MKLANRYGLDVAVYKEVDGTSKKVCSIDFANEVSIELSSEVSWATGEQTHRRIVGFGNPIEGTMTIQTQLVTNELLACIAGMAEVSSRIGFSNKTMQGVKYVLKCTTIWVSETGETRVENITVCNAVPKRNYRVNYSGDGEPQSIEVTFDMIADENGIVIEIDKPLSEKISEFSEGLEYSIGGDGAFSCIVGRGTCTDKVIRIPPEVDGYPTYVYDENCFNGDKIIEELIFPLGLNVVSVEQGCFDNCPSLRIVRCKVIATSAEKLFLNCPALEKIIFYGENVGDVDWIPEGVEIWVPYSMAIKYHQKLGHNNFKTYNSDDEIE